MVLGLIYIYINIYQYMHTYISQNQSRRKVLFAFTPAAFMHIQCSAKYKTLYPTLYG